jgi:hypothetical protein
MKSLTVTCTLPIRFSIIGYRARFRGKSSSVLQHHKHYNILSSTKAQHSCYKPRQSPTFERLALGSAATCRAVKVLESDNELNPMMVRGCTTLRNVRIFP